MQKSNKSKVVVHDYCYPWDLFTNKNRITFNRVDNNICHELENCELECAGLINYVLDKKQILHSRRIHLKKYCKLHYLPTLITDEDELEKI